MLVPTIEVKDWIIGENNSDVVILVTSYVDEVSSEGQVIVQGINPLSFFYEPAIIEALQVKGIEEAKKVHDEMVNKYDKKRHKKTEV